MGGGTLAYMLGLRDRRACEHWLLELANLPTPVSGGGVDELRRSERCYVYTAPLRLPDGASAASFVLALPTLRLRRLCRLCRLCRLRRLRRLISPHLSPSHLISSPHLISPHLISSPLISSSHLLSSPLISSPLISSALISSYHLH